MNKKLVLVLVCATFFSVSSCSDSIEKISATACSGDGNSVRTVNNMRGVITFDYDLKCYKILASETGEVDIESLICGDLPASLRQTGKKVVFSGTYKTHPDPASLSQGFSRYFLEISEIKPL